MANVNRNKLTAIGPLDILEKFRASNFSVDPRFVKQTLLLDFKKIVPQPPEFETGDLFEGVTDEREWNNENWGTTCNAYDGECGNIVDIPSQPNQSCLTCYFETAWAAPYPVYERLAELWPSLTFWVADLPEDRLYPAFTIVYRASQVEKLTFDAEEFAETEFRHHLEFDIALHEARLNRADLNNK